MYENGCGLAVERARTHLHTSTRSGEAINSVAYMENGRPDAFAFELTNLIIFNVHVFVANASTRPLQRAASAATRCTDPTLVTSRPHRSPNQTRRAPSGASSRSASSAAGVRPGSRICWV